MERCLVPEILDTMPPDAPEARASRRDLRRINSLMAHPRMLSALVKRHATRPPRRIVELGCGDARATLAVLRRLAPIPDETEITLVDAQPLVSPQVLSNIRDLGVKVDIVTSDVFDWLEEATPHDLTIANLFLHHFDAAGLPRLFQGLARLSRLLVATEPRRSKFALLAARSVRAIGANAVTRHDAAVSVRAGFRDAELTPYWPGQVHLDTSRGPLTHVFAAAGRGLDD
ncbi:methyltransferase family protein [Palleronia aestuarii]|uniref:Methyltransferase family protein n=1 Tax=Palleronia aestuarii TaxID=568105 RepID=A0A2W7NJB3_9RHOB|nr:methyltransferase family protein [Palleronia aestuarii]